MTDIKIYHVIFLIFFIDEIVLLWIYCVFIVYLTLMIIVLLWIYCVFKCEKVYKKRPVE